MSTPEQTRRLIETAVSGAIDSLRRVDASTPSAAIAHLQEASRNTEIALNEALAAGVVGDGLSMRQAAAAGGLAPNTLPARLAGTSLLGGYQGADRRVRAEGIARARYDIGRQPTSRPAAEKGTTEKGTTEEDTFDTSRPAGGRSLDGPAAEPQTDPSDSVDR